MQEKKNTNVRVVFSATKQMIREKNKKKQKQTVVALGLLGKLSDVDVVLSFFAECHGQSLALCECVTEGLSRARWVVWLGALVGGKV